MPVTRTSRFTGLDQVTYPYASSVVPGYIGFDPTAPSLHVGSLVQIMLLRRLQQTGHKPIVLMGGGTGKIGDPSFKDEARKLLTVDLIQENNPDRFDKKNRPSNKNRNHNLDIE